MHRPLWIAQRSSPLMIRRCSSSLNCTLNYWGKRRLSAYGLFHCCDEFIVRLSRTVHNISRLSSISGHSVDFINGNGRGYLASSKVPSRTSSTWVLASCALSDKTSVFTSGASIYKRNVRVYARCTNLRKEFPCLRAVHQSTKDPSESQLC